MQQPSSVIIQLQQQIAAVKLLFKGGDKELDDQRRPVSLLPDIRNIDESLKAAQMLE